MSCEGWDHRETTGVPWRGKLTHTHTTHQRTPACRPLRSAGQGIANEVHRGKHGCVGRDSPHEAGREAAVEAGQAALSPQRLQAGSIRGTGRLSDHQARPPHQAIQRQVSS